METTHRPGSDPTRPATPPPSRPHSRPQRTTVVCAQVTPSGSPDTSRPSTTARTPSGMTPTPRPASGPSMHHHPAARPSPQAPARSQLGTCSKARHTGRTTPDSTPQTSKRTKHRRPPAPVPGHRTTGRCAPNDNHSDTGTTSTAVITTTPPDQAKPHPPKNQKTSPTKTLKEAPDSEAPRRHYAARSTARLEASVRGERRCGSIDGSSPRSCLAVETQPEKESTLHRHNLHVVHVHDFKVRRIRCCVNA